MGMGGGMVADLVTRRGDLLTLKSAGAYGMSMASRYNLHDLPGAVYSDEIR